MEASVENQEYPHLPPGREPGSQSRYRKRGSITRSLLGRPGREAEHFSVVGEPREVARGGEVRATLQISDTSKASDGIEVGLVCTEFWDDEQRQQHGTTRVVRPNEIHKDWRPVDGSQQLQTVAFTVPEDALPSYEGAHLSIAWRISARQPQRLRRDPRSDFAIWVLP